MGRPAFPLETTAAEQAQKVDALSKRILEVSKDYVSDKEREKLLAACETLKKGLLNINKRYFKLPM
jgi:uncharacterized coiled-coil protein SlyX